MLKQTSGQAPYTSLSSVCAVLGTGIRETGDPVSKRGGDASNCWVVVALRLERSGTGAGLEGPRSSLPVTSYPGRAMGGTLVTTSGTSGRRGSVVGNGNSSFLEVATDRGLRGDRCVEVVHLSRWVLRLPFSWSYSLFSFSRCNSEYLHLLHTVLAVFLHQVGPLSLFLVAWASQICLSADSAVYYTQHKSRSFYPTNS